MSTITQRFLINLTHQSDIFEQLRAYILLINWHHSPVTINKMLVPLNHSGQIMELWSVEYSFRSMHRSYI